MACKMTKLGATLFYGLIIGNQRKQSPSLTNQVVESLHVYFKRGEKEQ